MSVIERKKRNEELLNLRFKDAEWLKDSVLKDRIVIGGVGGIGSHVAFLLGRMGFRLSLIDMDTVGYENVGVQLFRRTDIGVPKPYAVKSMIESFTTFAALDVHANRIQDVIGGGSTRYNLISCFDNMDARKYMFNYYKRTFSTTAEGAHNKFFMDGRMGPEHFEIYFVHNGETIEQYEKTLFDDKAIPELNCAFKATPHNAFILSGLMVGLLTNHISNIVKEMDIRVVPFKTTFHIPMFHLTTQE